MELVLNPHYSGGS